ncbi:trace amine-associated receptor 1-like [Eucyclogobius newberryi]|uniref:trace amine-associated receptor 1-like n=1 Tax=Eucyclogobius newberryi TaxID=166745 RepID=UPI003B5A900D
MAFILSSGVCEIVNVFMLSSYGSTDRKIECQVHRKARCSPEHQLVRGKTGDAVSLLLKVMETPGEALCFPLSNNSCRKTLRAKSEETVIYSLLFSITVITVFLNLLVIVSIHHFRQLQTCTNILLLSLAVSDILVGFLQMPFQILYYHGCWFLGDFACALNNFCSFLVVSASVGNMVLISVDRYIAICDPMLYPFKVTVTRVKVCILLCWIFSTIHAVWILRDLLRQPDIYKSCIGECVVIVNYAEGVVDLVVTFLAPMIVITFLYIRVFVVAVSQARAMRSQISSITVGPIAIRVQKTEMKAAKTLGLLVIVFLLCSCPYYCFTVAADSNLFGASSGEAELWLIYLNSCINPIIYVFCYPWFRKTVKMILTLKIFKTDSCEAKVL